MRLVRLLLAAGLLLLPGLTLPAAPAQAASAIVETRRIGTSVQGRPIMAWRLGQPSSTNKVVLISTMHGDEPHTRRILDSLKNGAPIRGADIWVIPILNPDGFANKTRKNAHGVDLNRNFAWNWRNLDGKYESGAGPASEPETKALVAFLKQVRPGRIVSFHQPLYGVGRDSKRPRFAARLSNNLNLPLKSFSCGGTCYGTMTSWYNHYFAGVAITVEYGAHPSWERMNRRAPRQLLRSVDASR